MAITTLKSETAQQSEEWTSKYISLILFNQRKGKEMEFWFQSSSLVENCYLQNTSNILIIFNCTP